MVMAVLASGCAAAGKQAAPTAPEAPEPVSPSTTGMPADEAVDIETLEADLAREEEVLRSLMAQRDIVADGPTEMQEPPSKSPQQPPVSGMSEAEPESGEKTRCGRACRALESMRRSAEGICRLAEGEERCDRAKERVGDAETMVSSAGCSC